MKIPIALSSSGVLSIEGRKYSSNIEMAECFDYPENFLLFVILLGNFDAAFGAESTNINSTIWEIYVLKNCSRTSVGRGPVL